MLNISFNDLQSIQSSIKYQNNSFSPLQGLNYELENNSIKKREEYVRRIDLEKPDHHIVIIDVLASTKFRTINEILIEEPWCNG